MILQDHQKTAGPQRAQQPKAAVNKDRERVLRTGEPSCRTTRIVGRAARAGAVCLPPVRTSPICSLSRLLFAIIIQLYFPPRELPCGTPSLGFGASRPITWTLSRFVFSRIAPEFQKTIYSSDTVL
jgi:hypothetical protein